MIPLINKLGEKFIRFQLVLNKAHFSLWWFITIIRIISFKSIQVQFGFLHSLHTTCDSVKIFLKDTSVFVIFFEFIEWLWLFATCGTTLIAKSVFMFLFSTLVLFNLLEQSLVFNFFSCLAHFFISFARHSSSLDDIV